MSIEKIQANIIELNDSNDIYMTMNVLLITSNTNLNGAKFLPDFIHEIVENKEFYIGIPLVCERDKLENGKYKNLGHALKRDGSFATQQVGSFVDFYELETEENEIELYGVVKVFKRYQKVCSAILELFQEKSLFFSVEVVVGEYDSFTEKERTINAHQDNRLFGDCIVTTPAEKKSTARLLIAEALNIDIGGDKVNIKPIEEFFEKTLFHFENSELDITQVRMKVYNKICETYGEEVCCMCCTDFGVNYMVLQDYTSGDYFRIDYTVGESDVTISELYKVTKNYMPVTPPEVVEPDPESNSSDSMESPFSEDMSVNEVSVDESTNAVEESECDCGSDECAVCKTKMKADVEESKKKATCSVEESEVNEVQSSDETIITELNNIIAEKETLINELTEKVNTLSETVVLKDSELAELAELKAEMDKINLEKAENEKIEKQNNLRDKYSKLLSDAILDSTEIAEAICNLDELTLQAKVVEYALEKAETKKVEPKDSMITASRVLDTMDLHGSDVISKYITMYK